MKTRIKLLLALLLVGGLATSAYAQRANNANVGKGVYKSAATAEEIQEMKKGDRYAKVCMECKSVTVKEIADDKEVEALCHDGGTLHCDACEKKVKIKRMGPRKNIIRSEIVYVNGRVRNACSSFRSKSDSMTEPILPCRHQEADRASDDVRIIGILVTWPFAHLGNVVRSD